jgi:hypothetical protein
VVSLFGEIPTCHDHAHPAFTQEETLTLPTMQENIERRDAKSNFIIVIGQQPLNRACRLNSVSVALLWYRGRRKSS